MAIRRTAGGRAPCSLEFGYQFVSVGEPSSPLRLRHSHSKFKGLNFVRLQIERIAVWLSIHARAGIFDKVCLIHGANGKAPLRAHAMAGPSRSLIDPHYHGSILAGLYRGDYGIVIRNF